MLFLFPRIENNPIIVLTQVFPCSSMMNAQSNHVLSVHSRGHHVNFSRTVDLAEQFFVYDLFLFLFRGCLGGFEAKTYEAHL